MFKEKFNKSIRFEFLSIISVILFVSTLVLSFVIAINEGRVLKNSLITTGQSFASYIAKLGRDPLIMKDSIQLDAIVTDANKDENIAYTIIRDEQGAPLTSQYASINYRLPRFNAILLELSRDYELQDIIDAIKKKEPVIEVSTPIMIDIKTIGAVTIGMSTRKMHQEIVKTILFVIALNVAVAFVLGAVLFVASKKIVFDPLIELAHASSRLAKGDLSTLVKVRTTGEVKTLVDSFNEMVNNLEKVTVSKDYVDNIIRSMINTLIVVSTDDKIIRANDAACRVLGYEEEELIGRPAETIFGGERSRKDSWMKTMLADGRVGNIEESYRAKNGREFPVLFSASVMREDNNLFRGAVYVAQDITERKRAEVALYTEKQRFQTLSEQAPFGMVMIEKDGTFRYINPKFRELFGYELTDVPDGKTWFRKAYPDPTYRHHVIGTWIKDLEVFKPGEKRSEVFTVTCKDGTEKIINFIPVQLATGENLMACENITERKRAEEEKQRLEERLSRSKKMEALGTLSGGVAHDLNNVLGVLAGYSELLLMEMGETHPLRSHVSYILQASQKAAAIIQDLLTLARRGVSVSQVVNLNDVVSSYLKTPEFEKLKSHHPSVTFKLKLEKDLLNVKGSSVHLEKTVINLLSNAAEAISRSHGEVTLMTENRYLDKPVTGYDEIREGDYVVLRVSDNGKGISTVDIGKIFEPFYTKKVMGRSGTGLGLAVVWGTVKDHGGYIDVQSEEGRGSAFTVYFPVTREEMVSDQKGVSAESYRGRGESILVVDDVNEQRDLATAMLNSLGYRVSTVVSGEEAVSYLKTDKADLLVLDMIMDPGMDGLETYQKVLEINPKQKAIIVSGFSETDRVMKAQELGAGAYVRKPYIQEKLGLAIRKELDK